MQARINLPRYSGWLAIGYPLTTLLQINSRTLVGLPVGTRSEVDGETAAGASELISSDVWFTEESPSPWGVRRGKKARCRAPEMRRASQV